MVIDPEDFLPSYLMIFFSKIGSPHRVLEIWFLHDYKMRMAMLQSFTCDFLWGVGTY